MANMEHYKWLWGERVYLTTSQEAELVGEIIARADSETLKWFWGERVYLTTIQEGKTFQAMLMAEKIIVATFHRGKKNQLHQVRKAIGGTHLNMMFLYAMLARIKNLL